MTQNAAQTMKSRLRADLRGAMKAGNADEAKLIRSLIAALDNAEAPPVRAGTGAMDQHRFRDGSAEIARLDLEAAQVRAILAAEAAERDQAAAEMDRLARPDRAAALRAEAHLARRYLD